MLRRALILSLGLFSASAQAADATIDQVSGLLQSEFRAFSEDMGSIVSYRAMAPVEPLGLTGFDASIEFIDMTLGSPSTFEAASSDFSGDSLIVPRVHLHKGLPFGVDVGMSVTKIPNSNIENIGYEFRYAILSGGMVMPAVGVRFHQSSLDGVDDLTLDTKGLELGISKGFAMVTPYAGIGKVWIESSSSAAGLSEDFSVNRSYVGVNLNLLAINIGVEMDKTGETTTQAIKFGWRW